MKDLNIKQLISEIINEGQLNLYSEYYKKLSEELVLRLEANEKIELQNKTKKEGSLHTLSFYIFDIYQIITYDNTVVYINFLNYKRAKSEYVNLLKKH